MCTSGRAWGWGETPCVIRICDLRAASPSIRNAIEEHLDYEKWPVCKLLQDNDLLISFDIRNGLSKGLRGPETGLKMVLTSR